MILTTNNSHRFMIIRDEKLFDIDLNNKTILGKYQFNFAENNHNVLVVSDSTYKHIMIDIEERANEYNRRNSN